MYFHSSLLPVHSKASEFIRPAEKHFHSTPIIRVTMTASLLIRVSLWGWYFCLTLSHSIPSPYSFSRSFSLKFYSSIAWQCLPLGEMKNLFIPRPVWRANTCWLTWLMTFDIFHFFSLSLELKRKAWYPWLFLCVNGNLKQDSKSSRWQCACASYTFILLLFLHTQHTETLDYLSEESS